jgi:hypothetical protein
MHIFSAFIGILSKCMFLPTHLSLSHVVICISYTHVAFFSYTFLDGFLLDTSVDALLPSFSSISCRYIFRRNPSSHILSCDLLMQCLQTHLYMRYLHHIYRCILYSQYLDAFLIEMSLLAFILYTSFHVLYTDTSVEIFLPDVCL